MPVKVIICHDNKLTNELPMSRQFLDFEQPIEELNQKFKPYAWLATTMKSI